MRLVLALIAAVAQDWPTYHGGFGLDGVADAAPPDRPALLWRFKAGGAIDLPPVAEGGRVFVLSASGTLHALGLDGRELWSKPAGKDVKAPIVATAGRVIVGSEDGRLKAYDAATGDVAWTAKVGDTLQGSPNVVELAEGRRAIIAVSQSDGAIHAVDFATGGPLWKSAPVDRCDGSPGVGGGRIAMGSCASALHLYDALKGEKTADVAFGDDSQVAGGVAIAGGVAFAGTRGGKVVAVDLAKKAVAWTNADSKKEVFTTPAVAAKTVVVGSDDGHVYALARDTGAKRWAFDAKDSPTSPVVGGNRVVVTAGGTVFLLDLDTGAKLWSEDVSDLLTSPALVGGRILVGADDGTLSCWGSKP
ncbi:MAG TPA: PQQ-binding-like beta-propeller repeat protein [Planctomycetota bacterium]|nr:PQQ-binding-like beta-propeller repeat protein [Planctomycetota bacterium]